jgi:NADH-quinone oxidoreductase subunit G
LTEPRDTVTITLDGIEVAVEAGQVLIEAAQKAGTYIPRFCWHPRMTPVGMCRMCLVEVEGPRGKILIPSCTTPVNEGMAVDTRSDVVQKAQAGVLEFLLANHPLDCPVCDKGGECPLQDQAFAYGAGESRFVEEKRHFDKPIEISDLIYLDRERCILCARCTRFSDEISGDPLIEFKDRGGYVQVNTFPDEPFLSYFSGNTVQICPVGALTAKPYRFKARPWDLQAVDSVSLVDAVHSKISLQASQNEIVRIYGVDNDATNHGWLSDKDRFIYEHVRSPDRITTPLIKEGVGFREATWAEAIDVAATRLGSYRGDEVAGIGGARSTNEEAYAFSKFMRTVVVSPHLDAQLGDGLDPQFAAAVTSRASIDSLERAATILLWGPDLKEELPVLYLRVRRAVTELGAKLVVIHPRRTGLDGIATHKITYRPGMGPDLLRKLAAGEGDHAGVLETLLDGPVVALVGRPGLAEDPRLAEAVAAFARELPDASIMPLLRRGNVFGALDMGVAPTLFPGRVSATDAAERDTLEDHWGTLPEGTGHDTPGILHELQTGELKALLLFGADPVRDAAAPGVAIEALGSAEFVVAFEMFLSDSARFADVVFPVAGLGEIEGTVTNIEGRVQKINRVFPPPGTARPSFSILDDLATAMGAHLGTVSAEIIAKEIAVVAPAYGGVTWDQLTRGRDRDGLLLPGPGGRQPLEHVPVDTGVPVVSDRLALHLGRVLYDDGVMVRHSPGISGLAPGACVYLHPRDAALLAAEEGDLVRVSGEGVVELPVGLDASLVEGTVYVPFNLAGTTALGAVPAVSVDVVRGGDA